MQTQYDIRDGNKALQNVINYNLGCAKSSKYYFSASQIFQIISLVSCKNTSLYAKIQEIRVNNSADLGCISRSTLGFCHQYMDNITPFTLNQTSFFYGYYLLKYKFCINREIEVWYISFQCASHKILLIPQHYLMKFYHWDFFSLSICKEFTKILQPLLPKQRNNARNYSYFPVEG
jgi:hypothetical protein